MFLYLNAWDETPHLIFSSSQIGIYTACSLVLRLPDSNCVTPPSFLGLSFVDSSSLLLSSHNCVSQFFTITLNIFISHWFCFSGQPWLIHWSSYLTSLCLSLLIYKMVIMKHFPYRVIGRFNKRIYVNISYNLISYLEKCLASINSHHFESACYVPGR